MAGRVATAEVTEQVTEQVQRLLAVVGGDAASSSELMARLGLAHRPGFLYAYLRPAVDAGLVEMTLPDKPKSSKQRYRLTASGVAWKLGRG